MSAADDSYYGIPLEGSRKFIPKDAAKQIIKQMKALMGSTSDILLGKLLECSPAIIWQMEQSGTCRLKEDRINLFLEKRPDIPVFKLLDGIAPPEFLVPTVIPEDASPQGEQPNPTGTSDEEKFKQLQSLGEDFAGIEKTTVPPEKRQPLVVSIQAFSSYTGGHSFREYFDQNWIDFFLCTGIFPATWLQKISPLTGFEKFSERHGLSSLETADTISEKQQLEISSWKETTLKERERKGAVSPVKRTPLKEPPPASYGVGKNRMENRRPETVKKFPFFSTTEVFQLM